MSVRRDAGLAVLVVLWALVILGMLAMSFAYAMRTEAMAARNGLDAMRAYYQARTGMNRAIALFAVLPADNVMASAISGGDEDGSYDVTAESEGGKIDVNFVTEDALKEILLKAGLPEERAQAVGAAILDWRTADDGRRTGAAAYDALPEPIRPRHGKLAAVEELASVDGVAPELYRGYLSRIFTVHGHSVQVNVNTASAAVLAALPGFTPEAASAIVDRRNREPFRSPMEAVSFVSSLGISQAAVSFLTTVSNSTVYSLTARGKCGAAARNIRCLVESTAPGGKNPVKILRWEDNVQSTGEAG